MNEMCSATCHGKDQAAYRVSMTHKVFVLCAAHLAWLTGQGLILIPTERRVGSAAVTVERRRVHRPAWLRNLVASDKTDWVR